MSPQKDRALRGESATEANETCSRTGSSVTLRPDTEAALARRARAQEAARLKHAVEVRREYAVKVAGMSVDERARLSVHAPQLAIRALEAAHASDAEAAVSRPAPPPAVGLGTPADDVPSYPAERPPGGGTDTPSADHLEEAVPR